MFEIRILIKVLFYIVEALLHSRVVRNHHVVDRAREETVKAGCCASDQSIMQCRAVALVHCIEICLLLEEPVQGPHADPYRHIDSDGVENRQKVEAYEEILLWESEASQKH